MKVHVSDLLPGDTLAQDTFTDHGLLVLSRGALLNENALSRLHQHHIEYVEIRRRLADIVLPAEESASLNPQLRPVYEEAVSGFEHMFRQALKEGQVNEQDLEESYQPLIDNCKSERDVVSLLLLLNDQDDYTYHHSVQVGLLTYYIARWLGWEEQRAVHAGKAGFLHDIGKCRIPEEILNKPGKLTEEEFRIVQHHARYGYEILKNSFDDEVLLLAALQHHERIDGSGYPDGCKGDSIHPVAKIVAVADTYSAMISTRVYQKKRDLLTVLKELYVSSFSKLDPDAAHTFIRHMLPNFIGKKVDLSGGITGTIVMNHPTDFFRPLVRTADEFIDLSKRPQIEIEYVHM